VRLAVSSSESATNLATGWNRYLVRVDRWTNSNQGHHDFATLGLDDNGLYITALQLGYGVTSTNAGHMVVAIKKPEIYQGEFISTALQIYVTNSVPVWTLQPVVNFDAVGTNDYVWFVAKGPPDLETNYQGGAIFYRRLQWSGTNAAWADTDWSVVTNPPSVSYRDYYDLDGTNVGVVGGPHTTAPAKGSAGIDLGILGGSRLAMSAIRNGFLWTCHTVGLSGTNGSYSGDQTGTGLDRSAIQWLSLEVDNIGSSLGYAAHGRAYDDLSTTNAHYFYMPSIMVNCAGDAVMGFSGSSITNYVGAYYSSRLPNAVTLVPPRLIRDGLVAYPDNRWGDYSATTLDPTDDWSFWTVQQYADPAGGNDFGDYPWETVVARIRPQP
jgi:hypothetical protein